MDHIVTANQLINIKDTILENAKTREKENQLLKKCIFIQYDVIEDKRKMLVLFSKLKSARYLYDFPVEENIKITPTYELVEGSSQRSNQSQVENAVTRYIDKQLLTTKVYNSIMKVSFKLTRQEVIYLINTFLVHKSEEEISEIIGISKTYLQNIKKSCIVKMWVDLEQYCPQDD